MPLTKRQKRRLLEVSKMIESSIVVKDDMEEIQLEYAQEIDEAVRLVQELNKPPPKIATETETSVPVVSKTMKNVTLARERRNQTQRERHARDSYVPPTKPTVDDAPEWAKRLWKGIAKKCHPDRLSFMELSAIQIARRQIWFLEAKALYEQRSWPKLVHIGVQVGEYVDDVTHKEQLSWLNNEYNTISGQITKMQSSLAWKWGTNWENMGLRINILIAILNHKSIPVPSREEITKILIQIESD